MQYSVSFQHHSYKKYRSPDRLILVFISEYSALLKDRRKIDSSIITTCLAMSVERSTVKGRGALSHFHCLS